MRRIGWLGGTLLTAWATGLQAHAHLLSAVPADNSSLSAAPAQLLLRFSESTQLTALWIAKDDAPKEKLAIPEAAHLEVSVALPPLVPGHYTVSWRALSADGHVVSGRTRFTLTR